MLSNAQRIVVLIVGMNVFLWVGGFIPLNEIQSIYPFIPNGLSNFNDLNINELDVVGVEGENLTQIESESFITQTLDFLNSIPVLGNFIGLIRAFLSLLYNLTFGFTTAFSVMGLPTIISVPITIILVTIQLIAIFKALLEIIAGRGGRD